MYINNIYSRFLLLVVFVFFIGCKEKGYSQAPGITDSTVVNCYTIRPVKNDSGADTLRDFLFGRESLEAYLAGAYKKQAAYDSAMDYVTSFGHQKLIVINNACFDKLGKPDSSGLINLYFNSGSATWIKRKSTVQFLKTYKKSIINFGSATVFEYRFNNVAEIEPHFMYIILKEQMPDEKRYAKDYRGIVICSDGMDWKDYDDNGLSIPVFVQMIRRSKELSIPLHYDGNRFIPTGHFKGRNWEE